MSEPEKCNHIKIDGAKCRANAQGDSGYCYYHLRYHATEGIGPYDFPVFEDTRSIIFGIHQTLRSFLSGRLEPRACGLALYGLQIAASVMQRKDARSPMEVEEIDAAEAKTRVAKDAAKNEAKDDANQNATKPQQSLAQLVLDTLAAHDRGELNSQE